MTALLLALALQNEGAVPSGLRWLSTAQKDDGSWGDAASTSLTLLAYLGAGYTPASDEFGPAVKKGLDQLMALDPSKLHVRSQALRALALCEAYGMTGAAKWKEPAQKAIGELETLQQADGAWADADASASAIFALRSAQISGLKVGADTMKKAARCVWAPAGFDLAKAVKEQAKPVKAEVQTKIDAAIREWSSDDPTVRDAGSAALAKIGVDVGPALLEAQKSDDLEIAGRASRLLETLFVSRTALAQARLMACRMILKLPIDDTILREAANSKGIGDAEAADYWYWAGLGFFMCDGPAGPNWKSFNSGLKDALLGAQISAANDKNSGSWDAPTAAERLRRTALNTLSLEVYYRYGR